jgi:RNA polymerase sigma-70 factor (ECF subfamily)
VETSLLIADEALVHSALAGDGLAFSELVVRHKGRVFGLVSRFSRNTHQIEDLAQETFIQAWKQLGKFRHEAPFKYWLSGIAVHVCYDFLRRQRKNCVHDAVPLEGLNLAAQSEDGAEEAREIVETALSRLKPEERMVLTLLELEGESVRMIAKLTGWSESNVKVRAFRAREALKKILTSATTNHE